MDRKEHKKADLIEADFVTTLLFKPVRASANYFTLYPLHFTISSILAPEGGAIRGCGTGIWRGGIISWQAESQSLIRGFG